MMIYIDNYRGRFGRMVMSHLMSDTSFAELHRFAGRLGLKREWFHGNHYDVSQNRRAEALRLGAVNLPIRSPEWRRVYRAAKELK